MNFLSYWHWIGILALIRGALHVFNFPDAHDLFGLLVTTLILGLVWSKVSNQSLLRPFTLGVSIYWIGNLMDWIDGVFKGEGFIGKIADTYDDLFFAAGFFLIGIAFLRVIEKLNQEKKRSIELQNSLYQQAFTDELTGLGNRRALFESLRSKLASQEQGTLLFIDVNNFKPVNDQYGHDTGDLVLQRCANKLRHKNAQAFRIGGDEFVVLLPTLQPAQWIDEISQLAHTLNQEYGVSFSIGQASYGDGAAHSADEILAKADHEMYQEKTARRNRSR
ncbi:GGDEF domain-containing protein [Chitinibacter sp. SCUT-21]|uniref:GGDEF domain-containing protein n=1 Tax=Chitinibacter sp. SCUT-21 TaxID=2970891 RepID=UPI0035A6B019